MPADSPAPSPPPLGVENYQLGAEISTGGMGSVLEAHDAKLDRTVAIKVMLLEANADARMRQRFLREAQVLAKLAHPNIVPIYDIVWEDGMPLFYSMKLVKGRTLQAILTDLRKQVPETLRDYSLDRLLTIFRKVCDAIAFAHSQGVLHRDLKPENIMVGEFGEVLVMDWGLAKLLRSNDEGNDE
jgi:serine/threonine protein kinase